MSATTTIDDVAAQPRPASPWRRIGLLAAKLACTTTFIYLVTSQIDLGKVTAILPRMRLLPSAAGVLLIGATLLVAAYRWQRILALVQIQVPWAKAAGLTYIGAFFSAFLPGATGGDVAKAYYLWQQAGKRGWEAALSVLFDRVAGMMTLFALMGICVVPRWLDATLDPKIRWIAGALCGAVVILIFALRWLIVRVGRNNATRVAIETEPRGVRRILAGMGKGLAALQGSPGDYVAVMGASVASQLIMFLGGFLIAFALDSGVSLASWLIYFPLIMGISALPISISGIGVREYLFLTFASALGFSSPEGALTASLAILAAFIFHDALGGIVYLVWRPSRGSEGLPQAAVAQAAVGITP